MNSLIEIAVAEIKELAIVEPKQASKKFELMANTMSDAQLVEVIENIVKGESFDNNDKELLKTYIR